jgi:hypothetical protein
MTILFFITFLVSYSAGVLGVSARDTTSIYNNRDACFFAPEFERISRISIMPDKNGHHQMITYNQVPTYTFLCLSGKWSRLYGHGAGRRPRFCLDGYYSYLDVVITFTRPILPAQDRSSHYRLDSRCLVAASFPTRKESERERERRGEKGCKPAGASCYCHTVLVRVLVAIDIQKTRTIAKVVAARTVGKRPR